MIDLQEVVAALRLRRHFTLLNQDIHPLHDLLGKLTERTSYLSSCPNMNLDHIVGCNMKTLACKRLADCTAPEWQLEGDLILHANLLGTNIADLTRFRKRNSNESAQLRRRAMNTLWDIIKNQRQNLNILIKIADKKLVTVIKILARVYKESERPNHQLNKIRDNFGRWAESQTLTTRNLRDILFSKDISHPKIILFSNEEHKSYFGKIKKLVSVKNKSGLLRLLYGDVYSADRLVRFGLAESDRCRRCFDKETIMHVLMDCPYTKAVLSTLRINQQEVSEILGLNLSKAEFEIRSDIINYLVFRQHIIPPEILVKTTLEKFANGLTSRGGIEKAAKRLLGIYERA